jgi:hypothetical protein
MLTEHPRYYMHPAYGLQRAERSRADSAKERDVQRGAKPVTVSPDETFCGYLFVKIIILFRPYRIRIVSVPHPYRIRTASETMIINSNFDLARTPPPTL